MLLVLTWALAGVLLAGCAEDGSGKPSPTREGRTSAAPTAPSTDLPQAEDLSGRLVYGKAGGRYADGTYFARPAQGVEEKGIPGAEETCCGRVSADGRQILFAGFPKDGRVTVGVVGLDGTGLHYLPLPGTTLSLGPGAWSPDGRRIAVQGWDESRPKRDGLYLVDSADGGHLTRLTHESDGVSHVPGDFSPDGQSLVFIEEHDDAPSTGQLFILNLTEGGPPRPLTPPDFGAGIGSVRFSPDGRFVLFADGRLSTRGAIWTVQPDGTGMAQVWDHETWFGSHPAWSPDGTQIVFALNPIADDYEHRPNALAVINADGTDLREVIRDNEFRREITWLP